MILSLIDYMKLPKPSNTEIVATVIALLLLIGFIYFGMKIYFNRQRDVHRLGTRAIRRGSIRVPVQMEVTLTVPETGARIKAKLLDLSLGGARLVTEDEHISEVKQAKINSSEQIWEKLNYPILNILRSRKRSDREIIQVHGKWAGLTTPQKNFLNREIRRLIEEYFS
ncbi:PilZ domain-containing protein [bacterium]|nr:PilZ domain-containing protein [bacterium]